MNSIAVYPGSFDPITNGHLDLLERGLKIFDKIIIAVAVNPVKKPLFTLQERCVMIEAALEENIVKQRVKVDALRGLLVDYVKMVPTCAILRGLRAISDFEYEFQMALMNRKLSPEMETLFIMTGMPWVYVSSRMIKEVVKAGGCVRGLVPEMVAKKLIEKFERSHKDCHEIQ